jgi:hypothetical protein
MLSLELRLEISIQHRVELFLVGIVLKVTELAVLIFPKSLKVFNKIEGHIGRTHFSFVS